MSRKKERAEQRQTPLALSAEREDSLADDVPKPVSSTPYDDVFRTMAEDCPSLLLPLLNELFNEQYTGDEKIEFHQDEHIQNLPDGTQQRRVTDSWFTVRGVACRGYHLECETDMDGSMLLRLFEYDSGLALRDAKREGWVLTVYFPRTAVFSLRSHRRTPKFMVVRLILPDERAVSYKIPVLRIRDYTLDDIFDKKLFFLLPFYAFSHETRFRKYEHDETGLRTLQAEYKGIMRSLKKLRDTGGLDEYTRVMLVEMCRKVVEHLAAKYRKVREGVRAVMGGQVLEYEAKTVYRQGKREGLAEGKREGLAEGLAEGKREGILDTARQLLTMGILTLKQIAQATGLSVDEIEALKDEK